MTTFRDLLTYYRPYWGISILSITAASLFEIIDLAVPYAIEQILMVKTIAVEYSGKSN